jgi:cytochrome b pre-mRNA-processing protein 3
MFKQFFSQARKKNRALADSVYEQIVAAARQATPYSDWNVPDTPLGRFEMLSLHLFLFLHRIKGEGEAADALGQELADAFFLDVDHSLRELGIGDMGIPKRMKTLSRMFYGRATSYGRAIDAGDAGELAAALARNVRPDQTGWPEAQDLAAYALDAHRSLAAQDLGALLAGRVAFPNPAGGQT